MTPKEKANELVRKMYLNGPKDSCEVYREATAKRCSLIAVDEIMISIKPAQYRLWNHNEMITEYWGEVQQEIEKL